MPEEMLVAGAEVSRGGQCRAHVRGVWLRPYQCLCPYLQYSGDDGSPDGEILTQIRRIIRNDVNFDRLDYLNDLSRYICAETPPPYSFNEKFDGRHESEDLFRMDEIRIGNFHRGRFAVFFGGQLLDVCGIRAGRHRGHLAFERVEQTGS